MFVSASSSLGWNETLQKKVDQRCFPRSVLSDEADLGWEWFRICLMCGDSNLGVHLDAQVHFVQDWFVSVGISETHLIVKMSIEEMSERFGGNLIQAQDWPLQEITLSKAELNLNIIGQYNFCINQHCQCVQQNLPDLFP